MYRREDKITFTDELFKQGRNAAQTAKCLKVMCYLDPEVEVVGMFPSVAAEVPLRG